MFKQQKYRKILLLVTLFCLSLIVVVPLLGNILMYAHNPTSFSSTTPAPQETLGGPIVKIESGLLRNPLENNSLQAVINYISRIYPHVGSAAILDVFRDTNFELNKSVSVFKVKLGDRGTYFSVDENTLEVQEGGNVLSRMYNDYLASLPYPYQKMSQELRMQIRGDYGELPLNPLSVYEFPIIFFVDSSQNLNLLEAEVSKFTTNYTKYDGMTVKFISVQLPLDSILTIGNLTFVSGMWLNDAGCCSPIEIFNSVPYLNGDDVHNIGINGQYAYVGVVDTGVDSSHPALLWIVGSQDFTDTTWDSYDWNPNDTNGHGTHVAGIIGSNDATYTGMAPGARILSAKVLGGGGYSGWTSTYISGVDWVLQQGAAAGYDIIVQTSWQDTSVDWEHRDGNSQISKYADYVSWCDDSIWVVSTGNNGGGLGGDGTGHITTPADAYNVIAVGATNATYNGVASFSSYGNTYDGRGAIRVVAPGEDIYSCNNNWETQSYFIPKSGTSVAAPHVSGLAALLYDYMKQNSVTYSSELIRAIIMNSANKLSGWTHGWDDPLDEYQGMGQIDALEAYNTYSDSAKWDYRSFSDESASHYYMFNVQTVPLNFSATIAWDRHVTDYNTAPPPLNDIDLYLYKDDGELLNYSISSVDNVEHIYYQITEPGIYIIEVDPYALPAGPESVGIAFNHQYYSNSSSPSWEAPGVPTVSSSTHPNQTLWYANANPILSWTTPSSTSGISGYSYILDMSSKNVPDTVIDTTANSVQFSNLDSGTYYFHIRARDNSFNWGSTAHYAIRVDVTLPNNPTSYSSSHTANAWSNNNTIWVYWRYASDSHSGVYGFSILWSNTPTSPDTTVDTTDNELTSPPLSDGCWYLNIRTRDDAGNWASTAYHIGPFYIDSTPPIVNITSPAENSALNVTSVTITWNGSDAYSGMNHYEVRIDGGAWIGAGTAINCTFSSLTDGIHTVDVRAYDNAGNAATDTVSFNILTERSRLLFLPPFMLLMSTQSGKVFGLVLFLGAIGLIGILIIASLRRSLAPAKPTDR